MIRLPRLGFFVLSMSLVASIMQAQSINAQSTQETKPDLVLDGTVEGKQNHTHFEIPFTVPANVHRVSVDLSYTGKEQKTALNLGVADPVRFRGTSGGNKSHFTISETDATPSYLPGAILPGTWNLLISVPNIRATEISKYHVEIRFNNPAEEYGFTLHPLAEGKRWYRGDLHMHTAHSDGSCLSQAGKSVPCPLFFTVQTAASRGLDFIAITEHNTDSHYDDERELQPYFDKLLLIPGREMTTFWGHFNIYGVTQFVDYRAVNPEDKSSSPEAKLAGKLDAKLDIKLDINAILRDVRAKGGIASINHADSPGGEICMGCAWEPPANLDMSLFTGVEVINGGRVFLSSADVWDNAIGKGAALTAIGGSDNHNAPSEAGHPGAIGWPTTVVEADNLSVPAILDGIRHGRVFIDLTASHNKVVDLTAHDQATGAQSIMGGTLMANAGDTLAFDTHLLGCSRSHIHFFLDGKESDSIPTLDTHIDAEGNGETLSFQWKTDSHPHWIRAEVRDSNGSLMLVSNPIYIHAAH